VRQAAKKSRDSTAIVNVNFNESFAALVAYGEAYGNLDVPTHFVVGDANTLRTLSERLVLHGHTEAVRAASHVRMVSGHLALLELH
jgi:hypothetical protein